MRRRDFLALAVGAAAVSPVRSWAQRTTTIPRVGVLWHAADTDGEWPYYGCLLDGFEELGYGPRKIELIHRFPGEKPGSISRRHQQRVKWVPAFPTEPVRGLKAHGTAYGFVRGGSAARPVDNSQ